MSELGVAELGEIAARIHRLANAPEEVGGALRWLSAPFYRLLRVKPELSIERAAALLAAVKADKQDVEVPVLEALEELEENVKSLERATIARGTPPAAHLIWLWRVYGVVHKIVVALGDDEPHGRRVVAALDPRALAMPLVAKAPEESDDHEPLQAAPIGIVDALLDAARAEPDLLSRKRRLLEAARRSLMETSAALPLDRQEVASRQAYIAREIHAIDTFQAAGVLPDRGLVHQARLAASRGDRRRLRASLGALSTVAASRGDLQLGRLTGRAIDAFGDQGRSRRDALVDLAGDSMGAPVVAAIRRGYEAARVDLEARIDRASRAIIVDNLGRGRGYLEGAADVETLLTTFAADSAVDVGGVLTPLRVIEETRALRAVRYPTDRLLLLPARAPTDIPDAVILDPRAILMHLAEGKLLARRYVAEVRRRHQRIKLASEVRVYVLDGSTSMIGPRARMRDAILLAELCTLMRRLQDPHRFLDPVLYYRYFTKRPRKVHRVDTPKRCLDGIVGVLSRVWIGETDIESALIASFETVRNEVASDPRLARAQIVLVTDGKAPVDHERVRQARRAVGDIPVRVSVIALGDENPALEALAAEQRGRGEDVFYQFLPDAELEAIVAGYPDREFVPPGPSDDGEVGVELAGLIEELTVLERRRDLEAMTDVSTYETALRDLGVDLDRRSDGERARVAAMHRDRRALQHRFDRWFPEPSVPRIPPSMPGVGTRDREDLDLASSLLVGVAEVVDSLGSAPLARQADAIEVLERALLATGLPPNRYAQILQSQAPHLAGVLRDVHRAAHRHADEKKRGVVQRATTL